MEAPAISILVAYSPHKGAVHLNSLFFQNTVHASRQNIQLLLAGCSPAFINQQADLLTRFRGISPSISPTDSSARSFAVLTGPFHTPELTVDSHARAISSSARVKVGMADFGMTQGVRAKPTVLVFSLPFLPRQYFLSVPIRGSHGPLRIYT